MGVLLLVGVTWPLWFPIGEFPRVSWLPIEFPVSVDWLPLTAALSASLALVLVPSRQSTWWVVVVSFALLIVLDQHRLQPWAYQTILYGSILAARPWRSARSWLIAVAVSIYAYSALGKLDYQFTHTVGRDMVQVLLSPLGNLPDDRATGLAIALPIAELLTALLCAIPHTRWLGGVAAIMMHTTLMVLLSPLGMNHSWGVLSWNVLLAVQAYLLFLRRPPQQRDEDAQSPGAAAMVVNFVVLAALVAPLSERWGYWDHWTSWSLYSPHTSRAEIQVHQSATPKFPETVRAHLIEDTDDDGWHELDVEQWSLAARLVPIYPQARYQVYFASELAQGYDLDQEIRVRVESASNRYTGEREESFAIGKQDLDRLLDQFWLPHRR